MPPRPTNEPWVDAHNLALFLVREKGYSPELADRLAPQIVANPGHPDRPFYTEMLRSDERNQRTSDAVEKVVEDVGDPYIQKLTASKDPGEQERGFAAYHREQERNFPELVRVQNAATAPLQFRSTPPPVTVEDFQRDPYAAYLRAIHQAQAAGQGIPTQPRPPADPAVQATAAALMQPVANYAMQAPPQDLPPHLVAMRKAREAVNRAMESTLPAGLPVMQKLPGRTAVPFADMTGRFSNE